MLTILETLVAILVLAYIAWTALQIFLRARLATRLIAEVAPYEARTTDYRKTLLILGDSTGVGVGADQPEDTVAARLAHHLGATYVENQSKSGAAVEDLSTQIQRLHLSHYDTILIMIGGNDMLAFHGAKQTTIQLGKILETLPEAGRILLVAPGNMGGAQAIPFFGRFIFTFMNHAYHKQFTALAEAKGITYVNLYRRPSEDLFIREPDKYLSEDGLHPSSLGYEEWFNAIKAKV